MAHVHVWLHFKKKMFMYGFISWLLTLIYLFKFNETIHSVKGKKTINPLIKWLTFGSISWTIVWLVWFFIVYPFLAMTTTSINHSLVSQKNKNKKNKSLIKYKCLWSVEGKGQVQVSKREFYTYVHLYYTRVEFLYYIKNIYIYIYIFFFFNGRK